MSPGLAGDLSLRLQEIWISECRKIARPPPLELSEPSLLTSHSCELLYIGSQQRAFVGQKVARSSPYKVDISSYW